MKTLIIGAGINGVLTGNFLMEQGHEVEIIEQMPQAGMLTTFANGCQLSFSHTTPMLLSPSIFQKPFHRSLFLGAKEKSWLKKHQNSKCDFDSKFHTLTKLAVESKEAFNEIFSKHDDIPETVGHSSGTMFLFENRTQFEWRKKLFEIQKTQYGIDFTAFDIHDAVEHELSLANVSHKVKHAIFTPFDRTLNAFEFTKFMAEKFTEKGGKIHYGINIKDIKHTEGLVSLIETQGKLFAGYDYYVYCGGAFGLQLLNSITPNIAHSLHSIAGYSMTFDVAYSNHSPEMNIIDFTNKMVYSRHGDVLRVAGFFDISPQNKQKRLQHFYKKALETFPILNAQNVTHRWSENRVFTHDEIPCVRKISGNFIVNTGHGHLGVTLSAGSAKRVARIISG